MDPGQCHWRNGIQLALPLIFAVAVVPQDEYKGSA